MDRHSGFTRRALLFGASVWPALLQPALAQPARTLSARLLEAARDSTVVLAMYDRENKLLRTTMGFQLDETSDLITNADALRSAVKIFVLTPEGRRFAVETVLLDTGGSGLARLSAHMPEYARHGVSISNNLATEDDVVHVACFTKGGQRVLLDGSVLSFRRGLEFGAYYRVQVEPIPDAMIEPALPVVNQSGDLVGVLTRRLLAKPHLYYVVPARRLPLHQDMPPALPRPSSHPN